MVVSQAISLFSIQLFPRLRRSSSLADIWLQHGGAGFCTDIATQTQRLTLDVVGLVAFSHDFKQTERIQRDLSGMANDHTQSTDRLLWAVNTFGEVLAQVNGCAGIKTRTQPHKLMAIRAAQGSIRSSSHVCTLQKCFFFIQKTNPCTVEISIRQQA